MLARSCSKASKLGFNSICVPRTCRCTSWIHKKQRNQRSYCQSVLDYRKRKNSRRKKKSASLTIPKSLTVWTTTNCGKFFFFFFFFFLVFWKILKEMGISDYFTCLLKKPYAPQKEQLEMNMEQQTGSNLGKEYVKAIYCHPSYLTFMQSTSCEMQGLDEAQAGIKIARRNIKTSDIQMSQSF